MLPTGECASWAVEAIAHLAPETSANQRLLHQRVLVVALETGEFQSGEHVLLDAHGRERVRLLEHHADAHPHLLGSCPGCVDVLSTEEDLSVERSTRDQLMHAVEHAQERRLPAAGWADEGSDLPLGHHEIDALEHQAIPEPGASSSGLESGRSGGRPSDDLDALGQHVGELHLLVGRLVVGVLDRIECALGCGRIGHGVGASVVVLVIDVF